MKRSILFFALSLFVSNSFAGGWTATAKPSKIEIIRTQGFEIRAPFGNPSKCDHGDTIFVQKTHPQYAELLSTAMAAYLSNKRLRIYSHQCISYGWHGGSYNELTNDGAMYIQD